ncbi:hypothetical protein Scep_025369 [Stephania cephalantha]|uniref:Uncharacterized protein n=1 Tax=Stephania cephalantha TaxID=152367 RepID=A0AAP0HSE4_9MAGN
MVFSSPNLPRLLLHRASQSSRICLCEEVIFSVTDLEDLSDEICVHDRERGSAGGKGRSDGGSRRATTAARGLARRAVAGAVESKSRTASAEVGSNGSAALQRELIAGDAEAGEELDGRQRRPASSAAVTRPIGNANGRAGVSSGQRAVALARQRETVGDTGEQLRRRGSDGAATGRIGSDEPAATRRNAKELTSGGGGGDRRPAATGERRRGCDAMNGAVARCRPVGCAISTKSRRRDGVRGSGDDQRKARVRRSWQREQPHSVLRFHHGVFVDWRSRRSPARHGGARLVAEEPTLRVRWGYGLGRVWPGRTASRELAHASARCSNEPMAGDAGSRREPEHGRQPASWCERQAMTRPISGANRQREVAATRQPSAGERQRDGRRFRRAKLRRGGGQRGKNRNRRRRTWGGDARRNAEELTGAARGGDRSGGAAATTSERKAWCDAMNSAVARCRRSSDARFRRNRDDAIEVRFISSD